MLGRFGRSLLAALAMAALVAGCSAGPLTGVLEQMPESLGGLAPDAPKAPAKPYQYPAVHDIPPPRSTQPMTEEQQTQLEKELNALRDQQEGTLAKDNQDAAASKNDTKAAKKPPTPAQKGQNTGAKTNP